MRIIYLIVLLLVFNKVEAQDSTYRYGGRDITINASYGEITDTVYGYVYTLYTYPKLEYIAKRIRTRSSNGLTTGYEDAVYVRARTILHEEAWIIYDKKPFIFIPGQIYK